MKSIEEKISVRLIFIGLLSMLCTAALIVSLFHRSYNRQIQSDMQMLAKGIAAALSDGCAPEDFATDTLRLTLIGSDGAVLYESAAVSEEENHLTRPEVLSALATGSGYAQRKSHSVGYDTTYFALRMTNGRVLRLAQNTTSTYAIYDSCIPAIVEILVVIMVLAVLFSSAASRSIVRPLNQMAEHLDDFAPEQVPYRELLPFGRIMQQDHQLRQENERMRREFTANISHELKTPLTCISGYAELLETGMAAPEDVSAFGQRIHKEADRMTHLVGDILLLSQLDGQHPEDFHPEQLPLDLAALAAEAADDLLLTARRNFITLRQELAAAPLRGDAKLLTELITNLLENAILYNRPGGWVCIAVGQSDGTSWLEVQDNGIGIPAEAQPHIFERFYRVDKSRSKSTGGTGLGLAIVKHIALLHRGKITLRSAPDEGTTIRIVFMQNEAEADGALQFTT